MYFKSVTGEDEKRQAFTPQTFILSDFIPAKCSYLITN